MFYLYRIHCLINQKNYIGQTINITNRWSQHKTAVRNNKPTQVIHHALIKHGIENFVFEHIASCMTQDQANELETELVSQYESHISTGKGYNNTRGGFNAPKTDEWKAHMSEVMKQWHKDGKQPPMPSGDNHWTHQPENANKVETWTQQLQTKFDNGELITWNKGLPTEEQPMFGKVHSEETKQLQSIAAIANDSGTRLAEAGKATRFVKGQKPVYTTPKGTIPWNKGVPMSDEQKAKLSAVRKGKKTGFRSKLRPQAIELFASGMTKSEIARQLNCNASLITRFLKQIY
jgi:group I intron endonuclease